MEDNFITKGCAIEHAERLGLALVCPDTSPRGLNIPGESDSWDLVLVLVSTLIQAMQRRTGSTACFHTLMLKFWVLSVMNFVLIQRKLVSWDIVW